MEKNSKNFEAEVQELRAENQNIKTEYERLKKEHDEFQAKVLKIQENHETINKDLIRRYKEAAEAAERDSAKLKERLENTIAEKNRMDEEAKRNIDELQGQLTDRNELQKEKLKADLSFAEAKKHQEKLTAELREKQSSYNDLTDKYEAVCQENEHLKKRLASAAEQIKAAVELVRGTGNNLEAILQETFIEPEETEISTVAPVMDKTPATVPDGYVPRTQLSAVKEETPVISEVPQETPVAKEVPDMGSPSIFRRAARFFGGSK